MSAEKQQNGTYKIRYRIGHKQFSKSGFKTKREAEAYEAEQLRKIRKGSWTDPGTAKVTLAEVYEDWIESKQVSERTKFDYREVWRKAIAPTWAHVRLQDSTPATVSRWVNSISANYSPARIAKAVTVLSQVFDWAVSDLRIPENPVAKAKALARGNFLPSAQPRNQKRYLSHKEVALLAESAGASELMILVMAYTGVRFGEVTALQVRDVDLLRNRLFVQRAWSDVGGRLVEAPPKSKKAREIPIPTTLREPLHKLVTNLRGPEALLFSTKHGAPLRYSNWRQDVFDPAVKAAGLHGLTPHGLRHTYAALVVQSGANPKVLQSTMGHSDIRLTLDTYGGLFGDDLDTLVAGLDKAIRGAV